MKYLKQLMLSNIILLITGLQVNAQIFDVEIHDTNYVKRINYKYVLKDSLPDGKYMVYEKKEKKGKVLQKDYFIIANYLNYQLQGEFIENFYDGSYIIKYFSNGILNGNYMSYSSKLGHYTYGIYINGMKEGKFTIIFEDLFFELFFENDIFKSYKKFDKNGNCISTGNEYPWYSKLI